jgi:hypothetical protein
MSNAGDRVEGRIKESKKCLYCGDIMQEAQMPGCPTGAGCDHSSQEDLRLFF